MITMVKPWCTMV